jgi:hypothetical protein
VVPVAVTVFAMIAIVVAAVEVPVSVMVPVMIMFNTASIAIPVAYKEMLPVMTRWYPVRSFIRRLGPIPFMPLIVPSHWIPITFHPDKVRTWTRRLNVDHPRWWRRTNRDSDGNLCMSSRYGGQ